MTRDEMLRDRHAAAAIRHMAVLRADGREIERMDDLIAEIDRRLDISQ